jgi:hypothetical protein
MRAHDLRSIMSELNGGPIPNPSNGPPPPAPAYSQPPAPDPGRTLGIVGFILAFFVSPAGIVVSAIGLFKSRRAGRKNGLALAGLILSIVFFIVTVLIIVLIVAAAVSVLNQCAILGGGVQTIGGTAVTCPTR